MAKDPELVIEFESVPEFREAKAIFEEAYVEHCLEKANGNVAAAARWAGKERRDFYELMRRVGVDPGEFRPRKRKS